MTDTQTTQPWTDPKGLDWQHDPATREWTRQTERRVIVIRDTGKGRWPFVVAFRTLRGITVQTERTETLEAAAVMAWACTRSR